MRLSRSDLPIEMEEGTYRLNFHSGLTCGGHGSRSAGDMIPLLRSPDGVDQRELCYHFYRDVCFPVDRAVFQKYDFRYDITVILPGTINGEFKKTSGHYHGYIGEGRAGTYPEIYEVLEGKALYILQKAVNFDQPEEPVFEDRKAVFVEAGQAIVIPPFYGHCSINVGEGPLAFSNIAVVACPLFYDTVKARRGLSIYALGDGGGVSLENNPRYPAASDSEISRYRPVPAPALGIDFSSEVYSAFIRDPEKFAYLLRPAEYEEQMLSMYQPFA